MREIKKILIYGTGMMAVGIAPIFAGKEDLTVTILGRRPVDVHTIIRGNLEQLKEKGIFTEEAIEGCLGRIKYTQDIQDADVKNADLVVECVSEDMELKQDLFLKLEGVMDKDAIFCTNTSVMSPTEISAKIEHKERLVGTHFWNPAFLIPLVEVVKSDYTDDAVADAVMDIMKKIGKKPVLCKKDVPGFIANRMQHALWREAISIVERGIADAKTVDESVKYSFGLRLPQLAPLENADMVGTDLTYSIHDYVLRDIENSTEPSPLLKELRDKGELGFKSGKGFQEWTPEQIEKSKRGLNEYLIKMLYGV